MNTNVLVVVVVAEYFAEALEEVLVKMTKGKPEKGAEKTIYRRLHDYKKRGII